MIADRLTSASGWALVLIGCIGLIMKVQWAKRKDINDKGA